MNRIEPVLLLLTSMVIFFTVLLLLSAKWFANDGQTFQVISNLLSGFAGALLMRVKPPKSPSEGAQPQTPELAGADPESGALPVK